MEYSDEFVVKVNEVFHDLEGDDYARRHPEIFVDEVDRWRRMAERVFADRVSDVRVLDFGCGSGFVARQLAPFLGQRDRLTCADLSARMLEHCRETVEQVDLSCPCDYVKLDGLSDAAVVGPFEVITLNSTLHHLPDLPAFFSRADTWLVRGGRMIIAHEPNRAFYANGFLRAVSALAGPRRTIGSLLRAMRLVDLTRWVLRPFGARLRSSRRLLDAVNARLCQDGTLSAPLTNDALTAIVDIHSPTAGRGGVGRGIDLPSLVADHLPGWVVEHFETYHHLGETVRGRWACRVAAGLARRYPLEGSTFLAVLTKP